MKKLVISLCSTVLLTTSAIAADINSARDNESIFEATVSDVYDWSGPYFGASIGLSVVRDEASDEEYSEKFKDSKFSFDVHAGINRVKGQFVYGLETEVGMLNLADSYSGTDTDPKFTYKVNGNAYAALTARAGMSFSKWLVYGKGGVALYDTSAKYFDTKKEYFKADDVLIGWVAGVGVEYGATDNWSMKLEYEYFDFDDLNLTIDKVESSNNMTAQAIKLGINYRY